ncbi:hypothetical protein [Paenibacillus sp. HJGM_3]|uniref:hypothetical protein n=1 Tax=Paenibacillus sp. HJGM_3 TaxID=3379816 RepID=UPI003865800F
MFRLEIKGMKLEPDLQIVQADVKVEADGEIIIDESMCVDVGLPALLYSGFEPTMPNRWAEIGDWTSVPFFVCGCGDPECRAILFRTQVLEEEGEVEWVLVEQAEDRSYREQELYRFPLRSYREQVLRAAEQFLEVIDGQDYRPLMKDTEAVVRRLTDRLRRAVGTEH